MPIYKPELSPRQQARHLSVAQELAAAGVRVDIPKECQEKARSLRVIVAGSPESLIYQLSHSMVLYVLRVILLAERSVTVQEFELAIPWDPAVFSCYPAGRTPYRFAPGLDFDFDEVLNHRIENLLRFRPGDELEGWLLAMGYKPVPQEYGPGRPAPVEVRLLDQFWQANVASVGLAVERSTKTRKCSSPPGPGLYEPECATASTARVMDGDLNVRAGTPPRVDVVRARRK